MTFLDKFRDKVKASGQHEKSSVIIPPEGHWNTPPTRKQMYRYRMHRGVNLGSLFTLEDWLTPSLFQSVNNAKSEYDLCKQLGESKAQERLERHWNTFIDEGDWIWMKNQGITTIRLPVSYYHFLPGHPDRRTRTLIEGTEYEPSAKIYESAFKSIERTIEMALRYEIGVLIDLHAAPGAQNSEGHSGLSTGKANFYNKTNMTKTIAILRSIIDTFSKYDNVMGVELINEPQDNGQLADWYKEAISSLRRESDDSRIPLVIGDCWNMQRYADVIASFDGNAGPMILDHHLYRCFTTQDCQTSAEQHAANIHPRSKGHWYKLLCSVSSQLQQGIIIGEWSAALNPGSLQNCKGHEKEHQRAWARAQLDAFNAQCGGHFFWTLKKEGAPDIGWCLYSAIEQDIVPSGLGRPNSGVDLALLEHKGIEMCENNFNDHVQYWNQNGGGGKMDHERYRDGFRQMFKDCVAFYGSCSEEIGFSGQWIMQRAKAHSQAKGSRENEWEFIHGATKANNCFKAILMGKS